MSLRPIPIRQHLQSRLLVSAFTLTALLAVFLCSGAAAKNAPDRNAARRSDAEIEKLIGQLELKLEKKPNLKKGAGAVLYRCFEYDSSQKSHLALRNFVMLVNDPDSELVKTRSMCYRDDAEIEYQGGWIWRDGKVTRLEPSHWKVDTIGGKSPQDVVVTFPELKKGDFVCYAVEATLPYPFSSANVRLSGDLPVMICNTRVKTGGFMSLEFLGHNLVKKKYAKKVYEEKDQYPVDVKYTVVDIPADRTGDDAPIFYEYQPYLLIYPKAQYNDMTEAWMENSSWNMIAVFASGYRSRIEDQIPVVEPKARELTAGLDTPAAKADAIYDFIQNDLKLVCFFDNYHSSDFKDILARGEASRYGKSTMMYAMCRAVDLPVDVLLSRDRQLGNIDRTACTFNQFTDIIVVLEGEPLRYYVPTTGPGVPGELPTGLRGLAAFSAKPDLREPFRELAIEAGSRSSANPEAMSAVFNSMLDQQDWSDWIILP